MRKRLLITAIICILFQGLGLAQNPVSLRLTSLFNQAEQCYLIDDYQQLQNLCDQYKEIIDEYSDALGDSLGVFQGYFRKMVGSYCYGLTEGDNFNYFLFTSEESYLESMRIFKERNDQDKVVTLHQELAQLYYKAKLYETASSHLDTVLVQYDEWLNDLGIKSVESDYYLTLSQLAMCNARIGAGCDDDAQAADLFVLALKQIGEARQYYKSKQESREYGETLRKHGKILMMQGDRLGTTNVKAARSCYEEYVKTQCTLVGQRLAGMDESQRGQYWLGTHQFLYDCYRLGNEAPEMLYDLALFSKGYLLAFERNPKELQTHWQQVRSALGRNECALEFVQYFGKNDTKRLGCLVLRHNSKRPTFIDLFSVDSLLNQPVNEYSTVLGALSSDFAEDINDFYETEAFAQLVWSPRLMSMIKDARKVYFSPDGLLHQWAIEYQIPDTTMIGYRLSSTRNLLKRNKTQKPGNALLCGGIKFGADINPSTADNDIVTYRYLYQNAGFIKELPYTEEEIDSIYAIRNHKGDFVLKGWQATDEAFLKEVQKGYDIIHLSTHGFYGGYLNLEGDIKPLLNDDSMSKCGILFAGSASTLSDKDFDENMFDGVLSGTELSKQNFGDTRLIVLSACQTGLGKLTDDGIYGLQRALKMAGIDGICVTLWSVSDLSSGNLMRYFYENLERQEKLDIHQAFMAARQRLKQDNWLQYVFDPETFMYEPMIVTHDKPEHVNPFILIDVF